MKSFVQEGNVITITAPYAVASGAGVLVGTALFGVAVQAITSGAKGEIKGTGVFDLAKATSASDSFAPGARVYWDNTNKVCTAVSTSNTEIGIAVATTTAATGDTTVRVKIPKTI